MFPSHIGSRSTGGIQLETLPTYMVSIPHWFSLNRCCTRHNYSKTPVSIPHWFSLNKPTFLSVLSYPPVSIPHWFSLNEHPEDGRRRNCLCFHPTLVLAQLACDVCPHVDVDGFPSHIGSRSTSLTKVWSPTEGSFHPTLVLAQPGVEGTRSAVLQCFHPTLVLAQPR